MTPSDMEEKVARAIAHSEGYLGWEQGLPHRKARFYEASRAAIKAMRDPSKSMEDAYYGSCDEHGMVLWRSGYKAMIDAA